MITSFRKLFVTLYGQRVSDIFNDKRKGNDDSFHSNSLIKSFNMENIFDSKNTIASKCSFLIYIPFKSNDHVILSSYRLQRKKS